MGKRQQTADILAEMGQRYDEFQRLKAIAEIVKKNPEWVQQEPQLKELLKPAA